MKNRVRSRWLPSTWSIALLILFAVTACTQSAGDSRPAAPQNVAAAADNGSVTVTWDDTGADVAGYRVYRSTAMPVDTTGAPLHAGLISGNAFVDSDVSTGQTYYYVVVAVGSNGQSSATSVPVSAALGTPADPSLPAAPNNLTATPQGTQIVLSWERAESGVRYNVYRSTTEQVDLTGAPLNSAPIPDTTFMDTNVTSGTSYYYVVTAVNTNDDESTGSNTVSAMLQDETPEPGSRGEWRRLAPSSVNRAEVSYVNVKGKFYLAGGSRLHEVYDPVSDSWSRVSQLPIWLDHIQAVVLDDLIYYVGGLRGWPGPQSDRVYIYDPATDTFSLGGNMPANRARGAGGTAAYDGKIYYAGGMHGSIENTVAVPWFDVYDPETESWTALPDMPTVRDHFHAEVVDGVFYAIGGRNRHDYATTPVVDAFDFATGTWSTLPTELPTERGGFATAVLGKEILVIGGERRQRMAYDTVEAYNTVTNTWRTLTPMLTGRHGIQAAVCNGSVYIAAGGEERGGNQHTTHTNKHDVFFLDSFTPCLPE